eukprot:1164147-Lingulodinium_polyedra.AAC.1
MARPRRRLLGACDTGDGRARRAPAPRAPPSSAGGLQAEIESFHADVQQLSLIHISEPTRR